MKKIIFAVCFILVCLAFTYPVQAQNNNTVVIPTQLRVTVTSTKLSPTKTPTQVLKPTESPVMIYYTGIWESCLTVMVNEHPDYHMSDIVPYCKQVVQTAIDNNFYKYRHSDMFSPLPNDVVIP